eukprot:scaffold31528_cov28-Tisochrysis_lutea.AAC.5
MHHSGRRLGRHLHGRGSGAVRLPARCPARRGDLGVVRWRGALPHAAHQAGAIPHRCGANRAPPLLARHAFVHRPVLAVPLPSQASCPLTLSARTCVCSFPTVWTTPRRRSRCAATRIRGVPRTWTPPRRRRPEPFHRRAAAPPQVARAR